MSRLHLTSRSTALALVLLVGAGGIFVAAKAGGAGAAILAAIAVACAATLIARVEPSSAESRSAGQIFDWALLGLPGALVVYFSFDSGGYFPGSPALVAIVLVLVLVLRITLVDEPFAAFSRSLAIGAGALGLFAIWILLSATWSDATGRALVEYDRA